MDTILAGVGMLVCLAIMALVMPLGMRVARRIRRATTTHTPDSSTSSSQDDPAAGKAGPVPSKGRAGGRRGQQRS
jgi:hypothetical protein